MMIDDPCPVCGNKARFIGIFISSDDYCTGCGGRGGYINYLRKQIDSVAMREVNALLDGAKQELK